MRTEAATAERRHRYNAAVRAARYGIWVAQQAGATSAFQIAACLNYLHVMRPNHKRWNADAVRRALWWLTSIGYSDMSVPSAQAHDNMRNGRKFTAPHLAKILLRARTIYIENMDGNTLYALPYHSTHETMCESA